MCYCVDKDGNEIYGTKTNRPDTPNCLSPAPKDVGKKKHPNVESFLKWLSA